VEETGGVPNELEGVNTEVKEAHPKQGVRRGRSRKPRDKSKYSKQPRASLPKFLQLGEALKEGGVRARKKKAGGIVQGEEEVEDISDCDGRSTSIEEGSSNSFVPNTMPGIELEVVLPGLFDSSTVGTQLLLENGSNGGRNVQLSNVDLGSTKLLQIQQKVGFCYESPIEEVVYAMDCDEQRDRLKKLEWEQKQGSQ
jgi:hypothetical protein